jgi:hypothetical protein
LLFLRASVKLPHAVVVLRSPKSEARKKAAECVDAGSHTTGASGVRRPLARGTLTHSSATRAVPRYRQQVLDRRTAQGLQSYPTLTVLLFARTALSLRMTLSCGMHSSACLHGQDYS